MSDYTLTVLCTYCTLYSTGKLVYTVRCSLYSIRYSTVQYINCVKLSATDYRLQYCTVLYLYSTVHNCYLVVAVWLHTVVR